MAQTPTIYKGDDASITISGLTHTTLAISDFSLTLSKGTAEQELLGEKGNYMIAGALSCEGSLTSCKLNNDAVSKLLRNMIDGTRIKVSGNCGTESLKFYFASCMITGFDFSLAGGDEITEGTLDFTSLVPYEINIEKSVDDSTRIKDTVD